MPLYFFDVSEDGAVMSDAYGLELEDLYEAREQAIALLPDMARGELPNGERHAFTAVVRCREGRVRYRATLLFKGRWIEPPTDPPPGGRDGAIPAAAAARRRIRRTRRRPRPAMPGLKA